MLFRSADDFCVGGIDDIVWVISERTSLRSGFGIASQGSAVRIDWVTRVVRPLRIVYADGVCGVEIAVGPGGERGVAEGFVVGWSLVAHLGWRDSCDQVAVDCVVEG